ncbi:HECT domain-containing protein [Durusdinium trenchii]|uniref:HECT domain-containing protein n=1 Tax=Durusdinium trenchii TaxID=1381693 RepID=A0ABP0M071_9DINO
MAKRLVADPAIGIMDLMKIFLKKVHNNPFYSLYHALEPPKGERITWKTSPNCGFLNKLSPIIESILEVAPNGVLQPIKVKGAINKMCEDDYKKYKVNKTTLHDSDMADACDQNLRKAVAQLRLLKQKKEEYIRAMKKATPAEKGNIDSCLSVLQLEEEEPARASCVAIVPYVVPTLQASLSKPSSNSSSNIFKRILDKQNSSPFPCGYCAAGGSDRLPLWLAGGPAAPPATPVAGVVPGVVLPDRCQPASCAVSHQRLGLLPLLPSHARRVSNCSEPTLLRVRAGGDFL